MKLELILKKGNEKITSIIYCDPKEADRIRIWREILALFDQLK